jgi:hypothetical protein
MALLQTGSYPGMAELFAFHDCTQSASLNLTPPDALVNVEFQIQLAIELEEACAFARTSLQLCANDHPRSTLADPHSARRATSQRRSRNTRAHV